MILRHVLSILVIFRACSNVSEVEKTAEQYSAIDLMNKQYISIKSSMLTPTYFSFVSIPILEYALRQTSLVFFDQLPMSSDSQRPKTLTNSCLSIFVHP